MSVLASLEIGKAAPIGSPGPKGSVVHRHAANKWIVTRDTDGEFRRSAVVHMDDDTGRWIVSPIDPRIDTEEFDTDEEAVAYIESQFEG